MENGEEVMESELSILSPRGLSVAQVVFGFWLAEDIISAIIFGS